MSAQTPWWDAAALERFLCRHTGAARVAVTHALRLSGGAIQENWWLQLQPDNGSELAVVLRCDAASRLPESRSRAQEFALLQVAWAAGVTVPEPLWSGDDSLGRDFFVMRKAEGVGAGYRLVRDLALAPDREQLAERIGREMARLHRVRPPEARLDFLLLPVLSPAETALAQCHDFLASHDEVHPALLWTLRWLSRRQPAQQSLALTHRDLRTGNYLVDAAGLTAILDWEFAAWSDPMEDLGWFCARCWRFGQDDLEAGGIGSRAAFYRGYAEESGQPVDPEAVHFWEVFAHLRWAVIALQQGARHVSGQEPSLELALTAHIVPELELELLRLTGCGDAAELTEQPLPALPLQPDAANLLATARQTLLDELLPQLPASAHYTARMLANALAIAGRELAAECSAPDTGSPSYWRDFAAAIDACALDDDHPEAPARRAALVLAVRARVGLSAPRALRS